MEAEHVVLPTDQPLTVLVRSCCPMENETEMVASLYTRWFGKDVNFLP